jgi:preprotein translocase subunit SecE
MNTIVTYFKESFEELKNNVTPPTFSQGQSLTILVAIFSIIFSLIIWGIDSIFGEVMNFYFNLFK